MFGTLTAPGSLTGDGEPARRVSATMQQALLAFARTGDPNYAGLARWEPYTLPRRQTMVFDVESRLADDPRGAERRLFEKVPFIQQGTSLVRIVRRCAPLRKTPAKRQRP